MPETACVVGMALTPSEDRVLSLVAKGCSNKEAAKRLWVTEAAIKYHLRHAYKKLGVRTRHEAALAYIGDVDTLEAVAIALDRARSFLEEALKRLREPEIPAPNVTATG